MDHFDECSTDEARVRSIEAAKCPFPDNETVRLAAARNARDIDSLAAEFEVVDVIAPNAVETVPNDLQDSIGASVVLYLATVQYS